MSSPSGPRFSPRYGTPELCAIAIGISRWDDRVGRDSAADWDFLQLQALEGKDVKDLLSNVGSGGGAATAPAAGGAAAGGAAAAEEVKEEKVEGKFCSGGVPGLCCASAANNRCREGGVG